MKHSEAIKLGLNFDSERQDRFDDILSQIPAMPDGKNASDLDEDELNKIRKILLEGEVGERPHQGYEHEIEFVFAVIEQLRLQHEITRKKAECEKESMEDKEGVSAEIDKIKRRLTECFFLETSYMLNMRQDENYLHALIDSIYNIAWKLRENEEWRALKKGLLGQVALFRLLEERGFSPELSHPRDDATRHVDMWAETEMMVDGKKIPVHLAIQEKHTSFVKELCVLRTDDELNACLSEVEDRLIEEGCSDEGMEGFKNLTKLREDFAEMEKDCQAKNEENLSDPEKKKSQKHLEPIVIILPSGPKDNPCIDPYTGKPNPEFFKDFKIELDDR